VMKRRWTSSCPKENRPRIVSGKPRSSALADTAGMKLKFLIGYRCISVCSSSAWLRTNAIAPLGLVEERLCRPPEPSGQAADSP
jgi:hypothetical protein